MFKLEGMPQASLGTKLRLIVYYKFWVAYSFVLRIDIISGKTAHCKTESSVLRGLFKTVLYLYISGDVNREWN